jgi:hypothetical protein
MTSRLAQCEIIGPSADESNLRVVDRQMRIHLPWSFERTHQPCLRQTPVGASHEEGPRVTKPRDRGAASVDAAAAPSGAVVDGFYGEVSGGCFRAHCRGRGAVSEHVAADAGVSQITGRSSAAAGSRRSLPTGARQREDFRCVCILRRDGAGFVGAVSLLSGGAVRHALGRSVLMPLRRNILEPVVAVALLLGAAACGGGDVPGASPSDPTTSQGSASPTKSATTEPAWEKKYTPKQLKAYEAALKRWEEYESRSAPIWSRGKATDAAATLFKQYYPSPAWQRQARLLASYEQGSVTRTGTADVYWSKPKLITKNGLSVEINQCVDYTPIVTRQNGQETDRPAWALKPNVRTISLAKPKGHDWLIYGVVDASSGKARPCEP